MKRVENKGIFYGCLNKDKVIKFDKFKAGHNSNYAIMAEAGKGMGFMVKAKLIDEFQREENESKNLMIIDPKSDEYRQLAKSINVDVN